MLTFPSITRDLHPDPLELKAHSGFDLKEKEEETNKEDEAE